MFIKSLRYRKHILLHSIYKLIHSLWTLKHTAVNGMKGVVKKADLSPQKAVQGLQKLQSTKTSLHWFHFVSIKSFAMFSVQVYRHNTRLIELSSPTVPAIKKTFPSFSCHSVFDFVSLFFLRNNICGTESASYACVFFVWFCQAFDCYHRMWLRSKIVITIKEFQCRISFIVFVITSFELKCNETQKNEDAHTILSMSLTLSVRSFHIISLSFQSSSLTSLRMFLNVK